MHHVPLVAGQRRHSSIARGSQNSSVWLVSSSLQLPVGQYSMDSESLETRCRQGRGARRLLRRRWRRSQRSVSLSSRMLGRALRLPLMRVVVALVSHRLPCLLLVLVRRHGLASEGYRPPLGHGSRKDGAATLRGRETYTKRATW